MSTGSSSFVALGVIFFVIGLSTSKSVFTILGIVFMSVGISAKRKKKDPDPPQD